MIDIPGKTIFSVSQLNRQAKQLLETHLPLVWVSGEISNFARPGSGHWYFSLKDEHAQVRCAMFKNANQRLRWQPQAGTQVIARVRVSLYEGRGDYQLIVEHMEQSGTGALQQAYEQLKAKLQQEGLFDADRKQALPLFPQHIGVITSPSGAAIRDILSVLKRRYPIAPVTIIPVAVQGESAAPEMINALQKAVNFGKLDVIIIGRGGGSIEDLWAFNNEALARAIANCSIPIISAVGHEIDFTLCDFVADVRAATPSASAEIATQDLEEWQLAIDGWQQQLFRQQQLYIQQKQQQLLFLQKCLRHPGERIKHQQQQLIKLEDRLIRAISTQLSEKRLKLEKQQHCHQQQHPKMRMNQLKEKLQHIDNRQRLAIQHRLKEKQYRLSSAVQLLNAINPLDVLGKGYSITQRETDNAIITNSDHIQAGDTVVTRLEKGCFKSIVIEIKTE